MNFSAKIAVLFGVSNFLQKTIILRDCVSRNMALHWKCRSEEYPRTNGKIKRTPVPDDKVPWSVSWTEYSPVEFTSESVLGKPWADPDVENNFKPNWNQLDGNINRASHFAEYTVEGGYPLNPMGRTGLRGRGVLGRWGPNHAADPIVTRWKRDSDGSRVINEDTGKPVLQFVAIKRRDNHEWAIPGGMVDPGEAITSTLKREFLEEALNYLDATDEGKVELNQRLEDFFSKGIDVYKGYVDDPRNTDNAWMETVARNFHDDSGTLVGSLGFNAGDDAIGVTWTDIHQRLKLYASHADFIQLVSQRLAAHW